MSWGVWECGDSHHVIPEDDLRPHERSQDCWCRPVVDTEEGVVVIHNALDGREHFETGARKPS